MSPILNFYFKDKKELPLNSNSIIRSMQKLKKLLGLVILLLILFVAYTFVSTGFFRSITPKLEGQLLKEIKLPGAEDMLVSRVDSFLLISSTNRAVYPPTEEEKGGLYLIDLKEDDFTPIDLSANFTKPFAPHGISMIKTDSTYTVMAINHTNKGHSIEVFNLYQQTLTHIKTLRHESLIRPNDLVLLSPNEFYVTNDHGYTEGIMRYIEEYGGFSFSNVVHYKNDAYTEVATDIAYANGINYDPARKLLFVASPRKFLVKVYSRADDGSLSFIEDIDCGTGPDNLEFGADGTIWSGAHPNLLRFSAYAKGDKETAPSEVIRVSYRGTGDYEVSSVYVEHGDRMSGSSVAVPWGDLIFVGNVMDDGFLVLSN